MRNLLLSLVVTAAGAGCSTLPANPCGELIRSGDRCVCPPGSVADEVEPWVCHLPDGGTIRDPNVPNADGGTDRPDVAPPEPDAGTTEDGATCTPTDEVCNGLDDDCSGEPDDAFDCVLGSAMQACTTSCGSMGPSPVPVPARGRPANPQRSRAITAMTTAMASWTKGSLPGMKQRGASINAAR